MPAMNADSPELPAYCRAASAMSLGIVIEYLPILSAMTPILPSILPSSDGFIVSMCGHPLVESAAPRPSEGGQINAGETLARAPRTSHAIADLRTKGNDERRDSR
ncbi:hypothetical protein GCM10027059_43680 [Myceligenerans halotolerans]